MSHPSPRNFKGHSIAATAVTALLLLTPISAAFASPFNAVPLEAAAGSFLSAAIGSPADGSDHTKNTVVSFTDASTSSEDCPITSWRWSFGDGANSTSQHPTHTYTTVGTYLVALQVRSSSCTTLVSTTSIDIDIVGIPPSVSLDGPTASTAGDELTFTATANDNDGGTVVGYIFSVDGSASPQQASPTFVTTLTEAGTSTVSVVAVDDDNAHSDAASLDVTVSAGPLASIIVDAPASAVVASTHEIFVSGADAHGNDVPLAVTSFQHQFANVTGPEDVCYTENNITGCDTTQVLADGLARIDVNGPASLVVNTTGSYTLAGFDAFENPVPLNNETMNFTAPTTAGVYNACYTEQNVTGCKSVVALADEAVTLNITGPASGIVNSTHTFFHSAKDQFNNTALLTLYFQNVTLSSTPKNETVCYTESNTTSPELTACIVVVVIAAPLDHIVITGPDSMPILTTRQFNASGFDIYNNSVPLNQSRFNYTAGNQSGVFPVCHTEQAIQGCKNVTVTPGPLSNLTINGPDQIPVGETRDYQLIGRDNYSNFIFSEPFNVTANTTVGSGQVCKTKESIMACKTIQWIAGPLDHIVVDGPATLVAGTNATYTLDGFDQYDNAVPLSNDTLDYTAPEAVGPAQVCYTEENVTGCKDIDVTADALFAISVTGPDTIVAGSVTEFALSGADQYGNAVTLSNATFNFTAPTAVGPANACYTEQNVSGCKIVSVVVDSLATILVSGPDEVEVGTSAGFFHVGLDQYGNAVDLESIAQSFTAPTTPGTAQVCYTEQGITGCKTVTIIGGPAVSMSVSGPAQMLAGSTAIFTITAFDAYGNPAGLDANSFAFTAPSELGLTQACYTEDGVTGCADVEVVTNPLASITVAGPATLIAGEVGTFALEGFDSGGNSTPISQATLDFTAPLAFGNTQVCYSENGIQGCTTVFVRPSRVNVTAPYNTVNVGRATQMMAIGYDIDDQPVAGGTFTWTATRGVISSSGVFTASLTGNALITASLGGVSGSKTLSVVNRLTVSINMSESFTIGEPVTGQVRVLYVDGTGAPAATVQMTFVSEMLDPIGRGELTLTTDANGVASFSAPITSTLPGDYTISALGRLSSNTGVGTGSYSVGA